MRQRRKLFIVLLLFSISISVHASSKITGQVSAVGDGEVLVQIDSTSAGQPYPQAGDQVRFSIEITGLDEPVDAGRTGSVIRIEKEIVFVRVEDGESLLGATAVIQASGSRAASSAGGLTPGRLASLKKHFQPMVDIFQHNDNSSCLAEQWCYSDSPTGEVPICFAVLGLCTDAVLKGQYYSPALEEQCSKLWGSLRTEDWKVIEYSKPCELPLPPSIQKPVFTQKQAICIAGKQCNESTEFAQKVCVDVILECAQDPSRLSPTNRAGCRMSLNNIERADKPADFYYKSSQCLQ